MQVPPVFSAIKLGGERAYDLAREGHAVELQPRPARVDRFELEERPDADHAVFLVESGKGVYMRSLARDLALACGTLGHIAALRRMRVGPFREEQAIPLDKLAASGDTPRSFPGPPASRHDRAGRHPGAGPGGGGGRAARLRPGDQPGGADGPGSGRCRPRWGLGARHGGGAVRRALPPGIRLAEAGAPDGWRQAMLSGRWTNCPAGGPTGEQPDVDHR